MNKVSGLAVDIAHSEIYKEFTAWLQDRMEKEQPVFFYGNIQKAGTKFKLESCSEIQEYKADETGIMIWSIDEMKISITFDPNAHYSLFTGDDEEHPTYNLREGMSVYVFS